MTRRGGLKASGVVALLTDFSGADAYAGIVRGVIAGAAPRARIVDITHDIPPHDIRRGAWVLAEAAPWFPKGTVFLAVVDPGVGGTRRPVAVETRRAWYVGPDNGLLALAVARDGVKAAVELAVPSGRRPVSRTFHARDIFAPAAARLAGGTGLSRLGRRLRALRPLEWPGLQPGSPTLKGGPQRLVGEVLVVDHFGNLITNLSAALVEKHCAGQPPVFRVGRRTVRGLARSYDAVARGGWLAIEGSSGLIEISRREASVAKALEAGVGTRVQVTC